VRSAAVSLWVSREVAVVKVVDGQRTVHDFTGHHWHHGTAARRPEGDDSSGKQRDRAQDHQQLGRGI
jgi:hypothetical protein